ncbi:TPA: helix-turn-helix domain-containing protein, partial [Streptococcus agalactiae]
KLRTGQYISLEKVEGICTALHCTPNDILEFIAEDEK